VVVLDPNCQQRGLEALVSAADIAPVERVRGVAAAQASGLLGRPDVSVVFENLAVAVVEVRPEQRLALVTRAEAEDAILAAEPERWVHASQIIAPDRAPAKFFPAYRSDEDVLARQSRAEAATGQGPVLDEQATTWGRQAIRANVSGRTGRGVRIAVLDTGVDTDHPDLADRIKETASFVAGETVEDGHGHGTHCIGTAAGPAEPREGPRYGVATEAVVLAGKVLNNEGDGTDGQILAGMEWAVAKGAKVISLSLGGRVELGELFPQTYEILAERALQLGTVIVAAAGNHSLRPGSCRPSTSRRTVPPSSPWAHWTRRCGSHSTPAEASTARAVRSTSPLPACACTRPPPAAATRRCRAPAWRRRTSRVSSPCSPRRTPRPPRPIWSPH
jgi:subtilisin family serine protease